MDTSSVDLWRAQGRPAARVLWDMVEGPMPRGLIGVGDPDLHHLDGTWTMFLGGFTTRFRNRLYRATLDENAHPAAGRWKLDRDARGRAAPLVADPPRGAWDAGGMHTPSYVPACNGRGARIYYSGRASSKQYGAGSRYSIGVLEQRGDGWVRHESPVVEGHGSRSSALEPLVIPTDTGYRMWYQANPHEIGPGEQPDYRIMCSDSADGTTGWSTPRVFADESEGFFDNAIACWNGRWVMLLARGSNLHGTPDFPAQGLWWMTADRPSADRSAWSSPRRLLDTDVAGTPEWFARGTHGPEITYPEPSFARPTVLFTATRRAPRWPWLALRRMARLHRPPVPAPFHLAVGAVTLELDPTSPG